MRIFLLLTLLLVIFCDSIDWKECGKTAVCYAHMSCFGVSGTFSLGLYVAENEIQMEKCAGILISPLSKNKWRVSMMDYRSFSNKGVTMSGKNGKGIFSCKDSDLTTPMEKSQVSISNESYPSPGKSHCDFTLTSNTIPLSKYLENEFGSSINFGPRGPGSLMAGFNFANIELLLNCIHPPIFDNSCDTDVEECVQPIVENPKIRCPSNFFLRFTENGDSWSEGPEMECVTNGYTVEVNGALQDLPSTAVARCARKKCIHCSPFSGDYSTAKKPPFNSYDECVVDKCSGIHTLMIDDESHRKESLTCSSSASANNSIWSYAGRDVNASSVKCVTNNRCDIISPMKYDCPSYETGCKNATVLKSRHQCPDTYDLVYRTGSKPTTSGSIVCHGGKWMISGTKDILDHRSTVVYCRPTLASLDKIKSTTEKPAETSIIMIVVIIGAIAVVIAGAIAAFLCWRDSNQIKKKKRAAKNKKVPSANPATPTTTVAATSTPSSKGENSNIDKMESGVDESKETKKEDQ